MISPQLSQTYIRMHAIGIVGPAFGVLQELIVSRIVSRGPGSSRTAAELALEVAYSQPRTLHKHMPKGPYFKLRTHDEHLPTVASAAAYVR